MRYYIFVIFLSCTFKCYSYGQYTCTSLQNIRELQHRSKLLNSNFLTIPNSGVMRCAKQCMLRSRCKSFNFDLDRSECQLNSMSITSALTSNIVSVNTSVVSDIEPWPKRLAGGCQNRECQGQSVCEVKDDGTIFCKTECDDPPSLEKGTILTTNISREVNSVLEFVCVDGYVKHGKAECQSDGRWSSFGCAGCSNPPGISNGELLVLDYETVLTEGSILYYNCKTGFHPIGRVRCQTDGSWSRAMCTPNRIETCAQVNTCNSSYGDGEYWLFPSVNLPTAMKIYCNNMSTSPVHYITLPRENYVQYPENYVQHPNNFLCGDCKTVQFEKIEILINSMIIPIYGNHISNVSSCDSYGIVHVCNEENVCNASNGIPFRLDTGLTGLIVKPDIEWRVGYDNRFMNTARSDHNRVITGTCKVDDDTCKYCHPVSWTMPLVYDPQFVPPIESATVPVCHSYN